MRAAIDAAIWLRGGHTRFVPTSFDRPRATRPIALCASVFAPSAENPIDLVRCFGHVNFGVSWPFNNASQVHRWIEAGLSLKT